MTEASEDPDCGLNEQFYKCIPCDSTCDQDIACAAVCCPPGGCGRQTCDEISEQHHGACPGICYHKGGFGCKKRHIRNESKKYALKICKK
ncbi:hypothetical protein L596_013858 [Steinernema carpocapsae]|uniref:Uncharacterized protein n=1 Tax=Steinernema carpocapsae TaxID=34508 RepID=A0A4U5P2S4_STECR|nr:hypothetical protein L596_013858 [Steinernema carpocapsae]